MLVTSIMELRLASTMLTMLVHQKACLIVIIAIHRLSPGTGLGLCPGARALGRSLGPKYLGDIDNFITKQEPKDYTLREIQILNMKHIIRQEPIYQ